MYRIAGQQTVSKVKRGSRGTETWAWTKHRKQVRGFWEIKWSAAYYCPSQGKKSVCILWNKQRDTKSCWHSVISSFFSLHLTEAIRAQDNSYNFQEGVLPRLSGVLQSKDIWRTKRACMPGNLFIPATFVLLTSLKCQTYHLFSISFLTIQTLPVTTPKHHRRQVPSDCMA